MEPLTLNSLKTRQGVSSFTCIGCDDTNAIGVLRYRVEPAVPDNTKEVFRFTSDIHIQPHRTMISDMASFTCANHRLQKLDDTSVSYLLGTQKAEKYHSFIGERARDW
ncbi:PREDICTED: uncharacterized protein LOC106294566 [Brassica oleracea var. oleracea]|uniref:uncharacterized protein LOC106294566 n=1 Tax=Brassica oleracea var. oleracea TaxID=109376 RepID=UPI0006A6F4BD|nr:PREDICTED: uncharacterized protein LOC106294566 [Brassica oleracea var. oleracea]